jgi:collagen type I/II/III/V/XI/XXIV/XXVII alpha
MRRRNASRQPLRPPGTRKHNARCPIRRRTGAPECGASPAAANDPSRAATDPATSPATGATTGAAGSSPGTERAATGASAAQTAGGRRSQSTGCPTAPGPAGFALGGADPASATGAGGRFDGAASVSAPTPRQSAGQPERARSSLAWRGQRCAKGPSGAARVSGGFPDEPATRRRSPAGRTGRHRWRSAVSRSAAASRSARRGPTGRWRITTHGADVPARADDPGALRRHARRSGSSPGAAKARWVFSARPPARNRPSGCRTFASGPTGHGGCGDHRGPTRSPWRFRYQPPGPRWLSHRDHADDPPGR